MKPSKIICLVFLGLFSISLFFIWFAASDSGLDRPQWEEHLGVWDYFAYGSIAALLVIILLWALTVGAYSITKVIVQKHKQ